MTNTNSASKTSDVDSEERDLAGVPLIGIDELDPEVRQRLQSKIDRLGYLGTFFQVTAHQPEALAAFIDYTDATKRALPDDLAEIVALTVATATGNDYERHQHERLSVKLGLGKEWVAAVELLDPERADLTPQQRAAQKWVLAVLKDHGRGTSAELDGLVRGLGPKGAIAIALMCGRYVAHATIANSFGIQAPVPSIFETSQS
ncbi:carboxymuconolactone decarboxylase family protein [Mycobacterium sp. 663a-19]|uniref:carboxymuconolactone decarboxylase family protein n=1 Tax=Mycobacterium sp. 663a-19 TaxID=2986148 RepID=UPI002D1E8BB7|nr:carboxymuconolactone decarboxylase family protein [Mycobacterium sp. 663a-19]MEB3980081.1 carboxymuconolactone decarboxylase family protein [Mycobacterium sp. 663a-19]